MVNSSWNSLNCPQLNPLTHPLNPGNLFVQSFEIPGCMVRPVNGEKRETTQNGRTMAGKMEVDSYARRNEGGYVYMCTHSLYMVYGKFTYTLVNSYGTI